MEVLDAPTTQQKALTWQQKRPHTLRAGWLELDFFVPEMTDDEFIAYCLKHPDLKIEKDKNGNIDIMPPLNFEAYRNESSAFRKLDQWNEKHRLGEVFNSNASFVLPNLAIRMPDATWVSSEKIAALSPADRRTIPHLVPDFVIEVRSSEDDSLKRLKNKMKEDWIASGVQLAWLLDPIDQRAYVYRRDGSVEEIDDFSKTLLGVDVLEGFEMPLDFLKKA